MLFFMMLGCSGLFKFLLVLLFFGLLTIFLLELVSSYASFLGLENFRLAISISQMVIWSYLMLYTYFFLAVLAGGIWMNILFFFVGQGVVQGVGGYYNFFLFFG